MRHTHLGVYGVMVQNGHVLLIRKARGPYLGMWDLPGGSMEFGESPEATLIREVEEETGLQLSSYRLLGFFSTVFDYTKADSPAQLHHLGALYEATPTNPDQLRESGDELDAKEARWVPIEECRLPNVTPFVIRGLEVLHTEID